MKILYFFLFLWVIFALLDPDPDPATQINADHPDPDPQPCIKKQESAAKNVDNARHCHCPDFSETVASLPSSGGVYFVPGFHGLQVRLLALVVSHGVCFVLSGSQLFICYLRLSLQIYIKKFRIYLLTCNADVDLNRIGTFTVAL
jgi:hypothetical protein